MSWLSWLSPVGAIFNLLNSLGNFKNSANNSSASPSLPDIGSSSGGSSSADSAYLEDDLIGYLDGLFASQGSENEINRNFNSAQAALNREFQSKEAQIQRDWYEQMSNSAYQRAAADMKAAGINPILAYQDGGAPTAGTGIATGSAAAYTATGGDSLSSILSSVADVITALSGSSASKIEAAYKIFKMAGG